MPTTPAMRDAICSKIMAEKCFYLPGDVWHRVQRWVTIFAHMQWFMIYASAEKKNIYMLPLHIHLLTRNPSKLFLRIENHEAYM